MDIRSIGAYYANPYYSNTMKNNNSTLAFKSHAFQSDNTKLEKRLATDANGFNSTILWKNLFPDVKISADDKDAICDLLDMMLRIIRKQQAKNADLYDRYQGVAGKNKRLNDKRTRYHQDRYHDQRSSRV